MKSVKRKARFGPPSTATVRYLALISIIVILCIVFAVLNPAFLGPTNLMNIVRQTGVTLVVSIGMTFIILTGGIDLSVGSNIAVSGMFGIVVLNATNSTVLAVLSTLILATAFGAVNGFLVGRLKIAAFIVTLAMQFVGRGATMLLHGATSIKVTNPFYKFIGQGSVAGIPVILIIVVVLYLLFCTVNDRMVFGQLYAIGGNSCAARACGIHIGASGGLHAGWPDRRRRRHHDRGPSRLRPALRRPEPGVLLHHRGGAGRHQPGGRQGQPEGDHALPRCSQVCAPWIMWTLPSAPTRYRR